MGGGEKGFPGVKPHQEQGEQKGMERETQKPRLGWVSSAQKQSQQVTVPCLGQLLAAKTQPKQLKLSLNNQTPAQTAKPGQPCDPSATFSPRSEPGVGQGSHREQLSALLSADSWVPDCLISATHARTGTPQPSWGRG